jgi:transcriptional regulator with XRE-family HTH domain
MEAHGRFPRSEFEKIIKADRERIDPKHGCSDAAAGIIFSYPRIIRLPGPCEVRGKSLGRKWWDHGTNFHLPENPDLVTMSHPEMLPQINIGETIRNYRLQKGMSQGDIEKRTGLLRCYLSRVENGHTIPSLDTLSKIAGAMEIALSQFFSESGHSNGSKGLPQLSDDEVRFLSQVRRYASNLNDSDRKLVLAMVKKMAANSK